MRMPAPGLSFLRRSRLPIGILAAVRGWRSDRRALSLALGVMTGTLAAGTVAFSIVDATAVRPLPYYEPNQLVAISGVPSGTGGLLLPTPRDYFAWLEATTVFDSLGASSSIESAEYAWGSERQQFRTRWVTANLFDVLGVKPHRGRFFLSSDEGTTSARPLVLSFDTWFLDFNADPFVINTVLRAKDGPDALIVGVLPPRVAFPIGSGDEAQAYTPMSTASIRTSTAGFVRIVGRLKEGVPLTHATEDVNRVSPAVVMSLHDHVVGPAKYALLLSLGAAFLFLAICCVNIAVLLHARALVRTSDTATQHALGASRRRIVWHSVAQGLVLVLPSAIAAWLIALWTLDVLVAMLPAGVGRITDIELNSRVFMALVAASGACILLVSAMPAWRAMGLNLAEAMQSGSGRIVGRGRRSVFILLATNIALVFALGSASSSVVAAFTRIVTADMGFERSNIMSIWFLRSLADIPVSQRTSTVEVFRRSMLQAVRETRGVAAVAISNGGSPLAGNRYGTRMNIPGHGDVRGFDIESRVVTRDYFDMLGMKLVGGRMFDDTDRHGSPRAMVINEVAQRRFFGGERSIGTVVDYNGPTTVVGVVAAVRNRGPELPPPAEVFLLADQESFANRTIVTGALLVKTNGEPRLVAGRVHEAVSAVFPVSRPGERTGLREPEFVDDEFRRMTATPRLQAVVMGVFGLMSLIVSMAGVYGTVAFVAAQQFRAIGLQLALGASPQRIRVQLLRWFSSALVVGLCTGAVGALALSQVLGRLAPGVNAIELAVYPIAAVGVGVAALAAVAGPVIRAGSVDPVCALRHEH